MKLRIHGNSIRLRLNRPEVAQLRETGRVEDSIEFGSGMRLAYAVQTSMTLAHPRAALHNGTIHVEVPSEAARCWADTEQVEIAGEQLVGDGAHLSILVEKDFQCMHKGDDANADAYPNPLAATP